MNKKANTFRLYIFPLIFVVIGIAVFIVGIVNLNKKATLLPLEAEIIDVTSEYDSATETFNMKVVIKYTVEGKEYTNILDVYDSNYIIGQKIDILYSPTNPYDIMPKENVFIIVMFVAASLLILAGGYFFIQALRNKKKTTDTPNIQNLKNNDIDNFN